MSTGGMGGGGSSNTLGTVQIDIVGNITPFEEAIKRAQNAARGIASSVGNAKIIPFDTSKMKQATKELEDSGIKIRDVFRDLAGAIAVMQGPLGPIAGRINFLGTMFSRFGVVVGGVSVATAGLAFAVKKTVDAYADQEQQLLTINALLKATGGASGQTADQLSDLADSLSKTTLASDDMVRSAEQVLLTFRRVSGEEFPRAIKAAQDLAAVGFGSIVTNSRQLGRALEDPIRGLDSLRRAGVTFTASQREMIRNFVESGRVIEAQKAILQTVEAQVGGAGAGQAGGISGAFHALGQAVNDVTVSIGNWITKTTSIPGVIRAVTAEMQDLASGGDTLQYTIGDLTVSFTKLDAVRKQQAAATKENTDAFNAEAKSMANVAEYYRRAAAGTQQGRGEGVVISGKTDEQIKAEGDAAEKSRLAVAILNQAIYDSINAYKQWVAARNAAREQARLDKEQYDGVVISLQRQREELLRTAQEQKIYDAVTKAGVDSNEALKAAVTDQVTQLDILSSNLAALGANGGPVDDLKKQIGALFAQMKDTSEAKSGVISLFDVFKAGIKDSEDALKQQTAAQERADALSRNAVTIEQKVAAQREQDNVKRIAGETDYQRSLRLTYNANKLNLDLLREEELAYRDRQMARQQDVEAAQEEVRLAGQSLQAADRERYIFQQMQQLKARVQQGGTIGPDEVANIQKAGAAYADANQQLRETQAILDQTFQTQTMFLSDTETKVASTLRQVYGEAWPQYLDGIIARQIRLNSELSQAYDAIKGFAHTFVDDIMDGKTAVDALSDALGQLQKKIVDMALDAVLEGVFSAVKGGLTGSGGSGFNIFNVANTQAASVPKAQTGGYIGSTPLHRSNVKFMGKLEYDEYPAILHVGERVIPAGGGQAKTIMSGERMIAAAGGIPHFEGGLSYDPAQSYSSFGGNAYTSGPSIYTTPAYSGSTGSSTAPYTFSGSAGSYTSQVATTFSGSYNAPSTSSFSGSYNAPISGPFMGGYGGGSTSASFGGLLGGGGANILAGRGDGFVGGVDWWGIPPYPEPMEGRPNLRMWSTGDNVRSWQNILRQIGYPVAVDGVFGPQTEYYTRLHGIHTAAMTGVPDRPPPGVVGPYAVRTAFMRLSGEVAGGGTFGLPRYPRLADYTATSSIPPSRVTLAGGVTAGFGVTAQAGLNLGFTPRQALVGTPVPDAVVPLPLPRPDRMPTADELAGTTRRLPPMLPPQQGGGSGFIPYRGVTVPNVSASIPAIPRPSSNQPGQAGALTAGTYTVPTLYPGFTPAGTNFGLTVPNAVRAGAQILAPLPVPARFGNQPLAVAGPQYGPALPPIPGGSGAGGGFPAPVINLTRLGAGIPFSAGIGAAPLPRPISTPTQLGNPYPYGTRAHLEWNVRTNLGLDPGPLPGDVSIPAGRPKPPTPPSPSSTGGIPDSRSWPGGSPSWFAPHFPPVGGRGVGGAGGRLSMLDVGNVGAGRASIMGIGRLPRDFLGPRSAPGGGAGFGGGVQVAGDYVPAYLNFGPQTRPPWWTDPSLYPDRPPYGMPNVPAAANRVLSGMISLFSAGSEGREGLDEIYRVRLPPEFYGPNPGFSGATYYDPWTGQLRSRWQSNPQAMQEYYRRKEIMDRSFNIHHIGGVVGSTPVPQRYLSGAILNSAPRLHDGLNYDEYPAILQRGERVIPAGGGNPAPVVIVNVQNNSSATVSTQQDSSNGNVKIDVMIDDIVAAKMRDGGSRINRTLAGMGARGQPIRR